MIQHSVTELNYLTSYVYIVERLWGHSAGKWSGRQKNVNQLRSILATAAGLRLLESDISSFIFAIIKHCIGVEKKFSDYNELSPASIAKLKICLHWSSLQNTHGFMYKVGFCWLKKMFTIRGFWKNDWGKRKSWTALT